MTEASAWQKGFEDGFKMALKLEGERIENVERTIITMASWIAQSSNAPLRPDEVVKLEKMLEAKK